MSPDHRRPQECVSSHAKLQLSFMILNHRHVTRYRRETQTEASAFSQLTLNFNPASMLGDNLAHDHQPESRAMPAILRRVEWIEDVTHHLGSHSRSGIDEIDEDTLRLAGFAFDLGMDLNLAAAGHRVEAVVDEIQEQLLQTIRRTRHERNSVGQCLDETDVTFIERRRHRVAEFTQH